MTETQAKSGAAKPPASSTEQDAKEAGAPAKGRAAVGRATVPADSPSPKFTRAPGMSTPPDRPPGDDGAADGGKTTAIATASGAQAPPAAAPKPPGVPAGRGAPAAGQVSAPPDPGSATARLGVPGPATARATVATAAIRTPSGANPAVGAARVTEAVRIARSTVSGAAGRGPRRARLHVKRIDPWSVMKFSFAVSLVLFIVVIVATAVLYLALDAMKVWESINSSLSDLVSAGGGSAGSGFKVTAKGVIGVSALVGAVNVVLFTALMTLGAFIYNVCADLVGGVELTLAERD